MVKVILLESVRRKKKGDEQVEYLVGNQKNKVSILDVADYFLICSKNTLGTTITPLKLQKLCYYVQAWSLVWDEEQLFEEEFEAWVHGPANYKLYKRYDDYYRNQTINPTNVNLDLAIFTEKQMKTMNMVWDAYGHRSGYYLEELTHQEDPWINARRGAELNALSSNIITKESMYEYYSKFM